MIENRTGRTEPTGQNLDEIERLIEAREADGCEGCGSVGGFEAKIDDWKDGEPVFLTSCCFCEEREAAEADADGIEDR